MEVFVVRHFFEDCNDNSYVGAYSDFWKALDASVADAQENSHDYMPGHPNNPGRVFGQGYALGVHEPGPYAEEDRQIWCEVMYQGRPSGSYYTIDRMELE